MYVFRNEDIYEFTIAVNIIIKNHHQIIAFISQARKVIEIISTHTFMYNK